MTTASISGGYLMGGLEGEFDRLNHMGLRVHAEVLDWSSINCRLQNVDAADVLCAPMAQEDIQRRCNEVEGGAKETRDGMRNNAKLGKKMTAVCLSSVL
jgi:hypothetical protein